MTVFAIIEPKLHRIRTGDFTDYKAAVVDAGLKIDELDFGTVAQWRDGRTLSIIVYEYGLMKPDSEAYFGFNGQLYNGNAVLFQANAEGETISLDPNLTKHFETDCTHFKWYADSAAVEVGITNREVARPQSSVNGEVVWEWKA